MLTRTVQIRHMPREGKKAVTLDDETVNLAKRIGQEENKSVPEVLRQALKVYQVRRYDLDEKVRRIIRILEGEEKVRTRPTARRNQMEGVDREGDQV